MGPLTKRPKHSGFRNEWGHLESFDTGHMLMHEAVGRAGGLMMVTPMFVELKASHPARPPLSRLIQTACYGPSSDIPDLYCPRRAAGWRYFNGGFCFGINIMSVEMARLERKWG